MVLSNKKLKLKLRFHLAVTLEASAGTTPSDHPQTTSAPRQTPSLKQLLVSATQKPRLSKRDKRRISLASPCSSSAIVSGASNGDAPAEPNPEAAQNGEESMKKKKKKRKRDGDQEAASAENGSQSAKKAKKAKKTKKSVKTWKELKIRKKAKIKEHKEGSGVGDGTAEEQAAEPAPEISYSYSQENGDASTKVYVGGIPYYSTEDDIHSFFDSCGTITEMECKYFPETGKFRGIAIIRFKTEAAAKRALALDGADMGGLYLKIQPYKKSSDFAPEMVEGYNRIYIGNLSWDITEDDLKNFFSNCRISSIRLGVDKETQVFRGYAHVDFSDNLSLTTALKLDQQTVCGRPVKIRCAVPKKTASTPSKSVQTMEKTADTQPKPAHAIEKTVEKVDDGGMIPAGKKKKRRTCYECGVAGHLSSDCPKKLAAEAK